KERQAAPGLEQRLGLVEQTIALRVRVEGIVVRPSASTVQENDEEVRGVREVGLPAEQEEGRHAGMADGLDERREVDGLERQLDADRTEVLLERLAEPHRSFVARRPERRGEAIAETGRLEARSGSRRVEGIAERRGVGPGHVWREDRRGDPAAPVDQG